MTDLLALTVAGLVISLAYNWLLTSSPTRPWWRRMVGRVRAWLGTDETNEGNE